MKYFLKGSIAIIGGIAALIVLLLNIFSNSVITASEFSTISLHTALGLLVNFIIIFLVLFISKIFNKKSYNIKTWKKVVVLAVILIVYFVLQVNWISIRQANPGWDQLSVYKTAVTMYKGENDFDFSYLQYYPHQLPIATFYSGIFKLFNNTSFRFLQILNAFANTMSMLGILFISKQLGKKHEVNNSRVVLIGLCFISLPLLSTFIYGDIISLPFCIWGIYFLMKYREKEKWPFLILSSILMALSYIARNNNVIWIIAAIIYLILNLIEIEEKTAKKVSLKVILMALFVAITLLPTPLIKKYWQREIGLNKDLAVANSFYLCMGINESEHKANGWFNNEFIMWAYTSDNETANQKFKDRISKRIDFFKEEPFEMVKFYTLKLASMWCENTNASLVYNHSDGFGNKEREDGNQELVRKIDEELYKNEKGIIALQKSIIILIFASTILVLIKYRKNISLDVILLVTIFIGGFLFHIMWESKSRYIIPYIVVLMPLTSMVTYNFENLIYKRLVKRRYKKRKKEVILKQVEQ